MRTFILLLALASPGAYASWVKVAELANGSIYAEATERRRDGDRVTMRALFDLKAALVSKTNGQPYVSQKLQSEYDCKEKRWRVLNSSWHSGNMAAGRMVEYRADAHAWDPVPLDSGVQALWNFACESK